MTSISQKYPWFEKYNERFRHLSPHQLPQSMLWIAPPGIGLEDFAREKARELLSSKISSASASASAIETSNLLWIRKEEGSSAIKIDQIRALIDFMNLKSFSGSSRLVILENADGMNVNAQNALLKTLEEPSPEAFIWLLTSHPKRLLPTVRSRCQEWSFFVEPHEAHQYFSKNFPGENPEVLWSQCQGRPLMLLDSLALQTTLDYLKTQTSPLFLAGYYAEGKDHPRVNFILDFLYQWILDWHRVHLGGGALFLHTETAWFKKYSFSLERAEKLRKLLKKISCAKKYRSEGLNLNIDLMLEDILIDWVKI
jgi:DNA polymerase-3 subunit delta'